MGIKKSEVLYFSPAILAKGGAQPKGALCQKCTMFLSDTSQCTVIDPAEVSGPEGKCGLMVPGPSTTSDKHPTMRLVPAADAGYEEGGSSLCANCRHFRGPSHCEKLGQTVHADACCNGHESIPPRRGTVRAALAT
jgi:hypothetical protein